MTLNDRILDFLDGSLPAEDEAELLHTLSVSPEKRTRLRGFMEQRSLFTRDAKSLSVPYETEQRLWARMDQVLPVTANEEGATVILPVETGMISNVPSAGFFAHAFNAASATLGAFTLVAGIGIGYFAGHSQTTTVFVPKVIAQASPIETKVSDITNSHPSHPPHVSYISRRSPEMNNAEIVLPPAIAADDPIHYIKTVPQMAKPIDVGIPPIATVPPASTPAITLADIGGDGEGIRPMLHKSRATREASTSLLSRFEFRIDESFGRQFPNSIATNVSLPIYSACLAIDSLSFAFSV